VVSQIKIIIFAAMFAGFALGISYLIGLNGQSFLGLPIIFLCALWAFGLNWFAFIPSTIFKTEKYYDLIGTLTYVTTIMLAFFLCTSFDLRSLVVSLMVTIWAVRLGLFLFTRIRRDKHDKRFETIKTKPLRFFFTWTLQGTWVVLTSACALAILTSINQPGWDVFASIGFIVWVVGFAIEVVSDAQKFSFRKNPQNSQKFISSGLWARSQHPNYFGEILLWVGITIMALPILSGWAWLSLISPFFVMFLLLRISGIPLLQKAGLKKWGNDPDFLIYRETTPKLIPKIF